MTLMQRRRALMAAKNDSLPEILYQLQNQIEHSDSHQTFFSGYALLKEDRDFTVFVDVNQTFRDCVPVFCAIATISGSKSNTDIQSSIKKNGGVSVGQWPGGPSGNGGYVTATGAATVISNYAWTANGRIRICVVHHKDSNIFRVLLKNAASITKTDISFASFPQTNKEMMSRFKGTLYSLTVYSAAKTDTECNDLMA